MNSVEADDAAVVQQTPQQRADVPPRPVVPQRRPRVREVSSRFMSLLVPSNPIPTPNTNSKTGECQRSKSVQRRRLQEEEESRTDEDIQDTTRSLESTPMIVAFGSHNHNTKVGGLVASTNFSSHKKYQAQGKRFKENNGSSPKAAQQLLHPLDVASQSKGSSSHFGGGGRTSRPDTPILLVADRDRIVPSRYRVPSQSCHHPSPSNLNSGVSATSAAAKLLHEATSGSSVQTACRTSNESNDGRIAILEKKSSSIWGSKSGSSSYSDMCIGTTAASTQQGGSCPNSPVCVSSNKNRTLSDVRSSMPEVDMLQMSKRWLAEKNSVSFHNGESCNDFRASTCGRSLNLAASSNTEHSTCTSSSWHSLRANDLTATYTPSRALVKKHIGSVCLPPHPSCIKLGMDARKGRKHFAHQEETHSLKLLHNYCLQWRFANAKAEASMLAQKVETERQFNCLGRKLFESREGVKRKRLEFGFFQRMKTFSETVESQMLYLDQWSGMEEEYSGSLSDVINSLVNLSLRLPVSSEVQVNVIELGNTFNSAVKVMDAISFHIKRFMLKAEKTENLVSDLARIVGGERSLIEECGDSLSKIYASQAKECSLRGHLFQLHRGNTCQSQE